MERRIASRMSLNFTDGPLIVRSDAEPAIGDVVKQAVSRREEKTELKLSPKRSKGGTGRRGGNKFRCGLSTKNNEARVACQLPVGASQRGKQAVGVDGETLRVAPYPVSNESNWQNGALLKGGQRIQTRDRRVR